MQICSWIDVQHLLCEKLPSFATCSWCTAETADFRYQVRHQNQATALDQHSLVVVSELKSSILAILQVSWAKKMFCSGPRGATTPIELKFGVQPSTIIYIHHKKFQPWTPTFYFFQLITHGPWVLSIKRRYTIILIWITMFAKRIEVARSGECHSV